MASNKKAETFTTESRVAAEVEHVVVPPDQGQEHGFIGAVRADKDRDAYTVTGVTGGTANVSDTPTSAKKAPASSTKTAAPKQAETKSTSTSSTQNS
jgi:hypothetical protein